MDVLGEVVRAEARIRPRIRETILEHSAHLSQAGGADVCCKLENLQYTGSFKVRGAMNKLLSLTEEELSRGVVAASTGNHAMAVAYGTHELQVRGEVFVTVNASPSKVRAIERLGARVLYHGWDCVQTEVHARKYAGQHDMTYVSPYNDPQVVGGQGTIAVELVRQLDQIDAVFVSIGGGGLISGIAGYLGAVHPDVAVVGCSPENSQAMIRSGQGGQDRGLTVAAHSVRWHSRRH